MARRSARQRHPRRHIYAADVRYEGSPDIHTDSYVRAETPSQAKAAFKRTFKRAEIVRIRRVKPKDVPKGARSKLR